MVGWNAMPCICRIIRCNALARCFGVIGPVSLWLPGRQLFPNRNIQAVIPTSVSNDPWWLISVVQSSILIRLRTWLVKVRCSGFFVFSICLVCCFHVSWLVVRNGGPLNHNSLCLSCVAEHPLDARSAGLSSDATCTHCSGFDSSWIRAIRFATNVWNDDAVAFIHANTFVESVQYWTSLILIRRSFLILSASSAPRTAAHNSSLGNVCLARGFFAPSSLLTIGPADVIVRR